jgi:hypothetical protein
MPRLIRQNAPAADSLRQHDLVQVQRVLLSPDARTPLSQDKVQSWLVKCQEAADKSPLRRPMPLQTVLFRVRGPKIDLVVKGDCSKGAVAERPLFHPKRVFPLFLPTKSSALLLVAGKGGTRRGRL